MERNVTFKEHRKCLWCDKKLRWGHTHYTIAAKEEILPKDENYFCSRECTHQFVDEKLIGASLT